MLWIYGFFVFNSICTSTQFQSASSKSPSSPSSSPLLPIHTALALFNSLYRVQIECSAWLTTTHAHIYTPPVSLFQSLHSPISTLKLWKKIQKKAKTAAVNLSNNGNDINFNDDPTIALASSCTQLLLNRLFQIDQYLFGSIVALDGENEMKEEAR